MAIPDVARVPSQRRPNLRAASLFLAFAFAALPAGAGESPKDLANALAALEARVAKLEGQIVSADLVGTYVVNVFQNELNANNSNIGPSVSSYVSGGTVELAVDGTLLFDVTEEIGNALFLGSQPSLQPFVGQGPGSFISTWTYADGTVDLAGIDLVSVTAGGRVMVGGIANHGDGTTALLILTRLQ